MLRFITPLRCLDCKRRFVDRTLRWGELKFSRCPVCLRQDLNAWSGKTYEPPFWMGVKVSFGAHKWRCEYCRLNFASFRPRKEVFTFSRWKKMSLPGLPGPAETAADYPGQQRNYHDPQQALDALHYLRDTPQASGNEDGAPLTQHEDETGIEG